MVTERFKIGILFSYNPNWTGGTYYILNLIKSLHYLPDPEKPELIIFYALKTDLQHVWPLQYPYIRCYPLFYPYLLRGINKVSGKIFGRQIHWFRYPPRAAQVLYPATDIKMLSRIKSRVYWIPDLQEKFYPEFFTPAIIEQRDNHYRKLIEEKASIIFSSHTAKTHFLHYYDADPAKLHVVHFASVINPVSSASDVTALREKYGLHPQYIICPNVLALNKNHLTVVKAIETLKGRGIKCQIVFTGKEQEDKRPSYPQEVKSYAQSAGIIGEYVKFLGFIDRKDQVNLIKHAYFLLQPSLFEGWSTSIEEAKSLGKYVLASDIAVHREQLLQNADFFDKENHTQLADLLTEKMQNGFTMTPVDYADNIRQCAYSFKAVLEAIAQTGEI